MPTPRGAQHRDLEQQLKDIDAELHDIRSTLLRRARLEVTEGDFEVSGGGGVVVRDGGGITLEAGDGTSVLQGVSLGGEYAKPNGDPQPMVLMRRDDGTLALSLWDPAPNADGYRQIVRLHDGSGHSILAEDANSLTGLAQPTMNYPLHRTSQDAAHVTDSGSWEPAYEGFVELWNPAIKLGLAVYGGPEGHGEALLLIGGQQVGPVRSWTTSTYLFWHEPLPDFTPGDAESIVVECRRTSGSSTIGVRPYYCAGAPSLS